MKMNKVKYCGLILEVPERAARYLAVDKDGEINWFCKSKDLKKPKVVCDSFWINHAASEGIERSEGVHYGTPKHNPTFNLKNKKIKKKVKSGWMKSLVSINYEL